ncbi:SRPBCC family protein [Streptomyces sp. NPDC052236]|uniref:SRPBCC family protein n=1 Tax=Streptomyces sp. NPDC052236 TaxID=3365686 RepID=UPI0037D50082
MAHIRKEFLVHSTPDRVWAALRDVGEVHRCLVPGFVTDTQLKGDIRVVTFASGVVVHELLVDIDDEARRVAYTVVGGSLAPAPKHHHASMQVFADGEEQSRFVWITDVTPDDLAGPIAEMMGEGARIMQRTLEAQADN